MPPEASTTRLRRRLRLSEPQNMNIIRHENDVKRIIANRWEMFPGSLLFSCISRIL